MTRKHFWTQLKIIGYSLRIPGNEVFDESDPHTPLELQSSFRLEDTLKFASVMHGNESEFILEKHNSSDPIESINEKNNFHDGIMNTEEQQKHLVEKQDFNNEESLNSGSNHRKLISSPSPPENEEEHKENTENIQKPEEDLKMEKKSIDPSLEKEEANMEVDRAEER